MDINEGVILACKVIDDVKGKDIAIIDARKEQDIVDFYVFATVTSNTHGRAIANHLMETLGAKGIECLGQEGYTVCDWIVLDFGLFFVHLFSQEMREKYNLEKFLSDGKNLVKYEQLKRAEAENVENKKTSNAEEKQSKEQLTKRQTRQAKKKENIASKKDVIKKPKQAKEKLSSKPKVAKVNLKKQSSATGQKAKTKAKKPAPVKAKK